jgi:hypothetical protein
MTGARLANARAQFMQWNPMMPLAVLTILISSCAAPPDGGPPQPPLPAPRDAVLKRLDQSAGIEGGSEFNFTISPDDTWLVFFQAVDGRAEEENEGAPRFTRRLCLLNLFTGRLHRFALTEAQEPFFWTPPDAAWAPDSSVCVLPPARLQPYHPQLVISVQDSATTVSFMPDPIPPRKAGEPPPPPPPEAKLTLPERLTCSDCFPHTDDVELMRTHLPKDCLRLRGTIHGNEGARQIVSPDGTKIYYQKGPRSRTGALAGR